MDRRRPPRRQPSPAASPLNARLPTSVDAARAGPLRFSPAHAHRLDGIERADSVAVSGHKWLFQPKDCAMILFRDPETAHAVVSFGGGYLARPNVGVQGSRGAAAIPLLATLLAWGRIGLAERIDPAMRMADRLAEAVAQTPRLALWNPPTTGIVVFRIAQASMDAFLRRWPDGMLSTGAIRDQRWLRAVAANPLADIEGIVAAIRAAADAAGGGLPRVDAGRGV